VTNCVTGHDGPGLHEGSRVVTAGVKLHEYLHVVSREVLLGNLPKLDVAGSNPVGRSINQRSNW